MGERASGKPLVDTFKIVDCIYSCIDREENFYVARYVQIRWYHRPCMGRFTEIFARDISSFIWENVSHVLGLAKAIGLFPSHPFTSSNVNAFVSATRPLS